mmetsp:Transcript_713/g.1287  ORF Transcript_713/g.1287 Transcript_713/m.1287 type:complete len:308 (+) Transcript_713:48-971(+)
MAVGRQTKAVGRQTSGKVMKKHKALTRPSTGGFSHGIKVAAGEASAAKAKMPKSKASSPFPGFARPTPGEVRRLHTALARQFGERIPGKSKRNILDTVVGTILSQNTTNTNSHRAFRQLKKRYPSWEAVRQAPPRIVQEAIRCGGLAPKKTKWIQTILKTLHKEHGKTSFEFLRKLSKEDVHQQLERFQGIGKKTSAIINCFDCENPDMAVDTHVFRYALQLGWAPTEKERERHNKAKKGPAWPVVTRDSVYHHLDALFPDALKYSMHLILTDTEGGLPTVCGARNFLGFDGKKVTIDGQPLKKVCE